MLRVQDGDAMAFDELEKTYRTRVLGWFCRRLGDRIEAEDLTQEVFLRLYRARATYRPSARFSTWVFHITQNVARNALRTRKRRPCVPLDTASAGLAGRQRAAVELHQFSDLTYTQVAAELDMTPKAAKSLLYRARNQLRVSLAAFVQ